MKSLYSLITISFIFVWIFMPIQKTSLVTEEVKAYYLATPYMGDSVKISPISDNELDIEIFGSEKDVDSFIELSKTLSDFEGKVSKSDGHNGSTIIVFDGHVRRLKTTQESVAKYGVNFLHRILN